jgi:hypothetical protein
MPLGEAAKGSGACNAGSGVMPGTFKCGTGGTATNCYSGSDPNMMCLMGGSGAVE